MVPQVSLLAGANHTSITNSTFAINVPTTVYNSGPSGISRLLEMICMRAMHDSSTRQSRCDPNTRQWALQRIKTFVRDPAPLKPVMWLHAPLGHGKSAIMQTSIESAEMEDTLLLAGAFFFARRQEGQDTIDHFLTTLAYQIAMKYPELYQYVDNVVSRDPTILSKSSDAQLHPLFVEPFNRLIPKLSFAPTIFIDGLDECGTEAQLSVLDIIAKVILDYGLPLKFIIASRPEAHLAEYFQNGRLSVKTDIFELDDDFENMHKYFRTRLSHIHQIRGYGMLDGTETWPSDDIILELTNRASGQYLFADTVVRFVEAEYEDPSAQLQVILSTQHDRQSTAFSRMDTVYRQILSAHNILKQHLDTLRRILAVTIILREVTVAALSDLLEEPVNLVWSIIRPICAIVKVVDPLQYTDARHHIKNLHEYLSFTVTIRHASLIEFLMDPSRAGEFYVHISDIEVEILKRSDHLLSASMSSRLDESLAAIHPTTWQSIAVLCCSDAYGLARDEYWPHSMEQLSQLQALLKSEDRQQTKARREPPIATRPMAEAFYCLHVYLQAPKCFGEWALPGTHHQIEDYAESIHTAILLALQQQLTPMIGEQTGFFAILQHLEYLDTSLTLKASIAAVNQRSCILQQEVFAHFTDSYPFLGLEVGEDSDIAMTLESHIEQILGDQDSVGRDLFIAYRDGLLRGLSRVYEDAIFVKKDFKRFDRALAWIDGRAVDLSLTPGVDDNDNSAMLSLISTIHSPVSQEAMLSTETQLSRQDAFLSYVARSCADAYQLGKSFQDIFKKLKELLLLFIENSIIHEAFSVVDETPNTGTLNIYRSLFGDIQGISERPWLNALKASDHTAILDFLLYEVVGQKHNIAIAHWDLHFSLGGYSPGIMKRLTQLRDAFKYDLDENYDYLGLLPPSFFSGLRTWQQNTISADSEDNSVLNAISARAIQTDSDPEYQPGGWEQETLNSDQVSVYEDAMEDLGHTM